MISTLKWAGVGNQRAVFHHFKMVFVNHVQVAGEGDKNVANWGGVNHRHHAVAIHDRFESFHRVNFG